MNTLNEHRHGFPLGFISQGLSAMRIEISGDDISNFNVVVSENFNNGVVAGLDLNDKEPVLRIDKYHGAFHVGTSNAKISRECNESAGLSG